MNKRKFDTSLLDEMDISAGGDSVVSDEIADQLRWADLHVIVFEYEGKFWQVEYFSGSTEMQESGWGYGYEPDEIEAVEVEPYEVTVTRYRKVK